MLSLCHYSGVVCRLKLTAFTHQFAYNFPESDLELEIEQEFDMCKRYTYFHKSQV
uniref:Uncharacterized protein n=1 Tax=Helianthus annuus TaxID=4232 RepID=A0A251RLF3_HELAN